MGALREGPVDAAEVSVEPIVLHVDGFEVPAVHARPDGVPVAGVVVHPDVGGLRPLFDDLCRRLATHGFAVIAVEPFARVPADERRSMDLDARLARIATLEDEIQIGDLEAAADYLVVNDDVGKVSVIGFCMGGHFTLKAAASDRFDRAVAFYGMISVPDDWKGPGVGEPLDAAADVCPTLAIIGSADPWTPESDVEALRDAWSDRDDCRITIVEGADHGFVHDPDRPAHRAEDAARVWDEAIAWMLDA